MTLQEQLNQLHSNISSSIPEQSALFDTETQNQVQNETGMKGPQTGDQAPDFTLPDQLGRTIKSVDLRSQGPLVVSFYRGNW